MTLILIYRMKHWGIHMLLWQKRSERLLHTYITQSDTATEPLSLSAHSVWNFPSLILVRQQWVTSASTSPLHFAASVLSLCLITRRSMLTVSLLGGERDWEIKFILNSFPLMWQLPSSHLPHLFSPLQAAQHEACSKAHLVHVVYTESISFYPQLNLKLHSRNGLPLIWLKMD